MEEVIRCEECNYCSRFRRLGNTRTEFTCDHPDQKYILGYFRKHRMTKMAGFLGYGKPYSEECPIKTTPKWCPKKRKDNGKK